MTKTAKDWAITLMVIIAWYVGAENGMGCDWHSVSEGMHFWDWVSIGVLMVFSFTSSLIVHAPADA